MKELKISLVYLNTIGVFTVKGTPMNTVACTRIWFYLINEFSDLIYNFFAAHVFEIINITMKHTV